MSEHSSTATVLAFDSSRVRPGLREILIQADEIIADSAAARQWRGSNATTPQLLRDYIPAVEQIFEIDDGELIERAQKLTTLAVHALNSGAWNAPDQMGFFLNLQGYATTLAELVCLHPVRRSMS